jgi:hypothetical protein
VVPSLAGLAPSQLGFVVRDLERAARKFDALLAAYFDTVAALGFYVEAIELPTEMPPVEFTL